ncbi:unnamed protein product [Oppiella nova]|uniref:Uncharacterized protein n=1 Tax=Oppiella nova TaxID=334625 RepID=A0A7R9QDL8_9ACAR|nr:unnamed protein product [Oppiella nova]CAG2162901.1 unnamed protein product [Oppiella nova]
MAFILQSSSTSSSSSSSSGKLWATDPSSSSSSTSVVSQLALLWWLLWLLSAMSSMCLCAMSWRESLTNFIGSLIVTSFDGEISLTFLDLTVTFAPDGSVGLLFLIGSPEYFKPISRLLFEANRNRRVVVRILSAVCDRLPAPTISALNGPKVVFLSKTSDVNGVNVSTSSGKCKSSAVSDIHSEGEPVWR